MNKLALTLGAAFVAAVTSLGTAEAFCGFYVSGSEKKMFADATQVVLVRDGTRTVLSMQNSYQGPLEDFAMVIPVPVVLKESDVKTLPKHVFDRIDQLGAPRLVEYWEQDPCPKPRDPRRYRSMPPATASAPMAERDFSAKKDMGVKIEAQFDVAEYKILILSAKEATGLEAWLAQNNYKIPSGAEPLLRPYVEAGSKFFVAKVDPKKVQMVDNVAALSPLRFHYDSEEFSLPIRLGMANSSGKQDLIVNIISPDKRYEVANYKNVVIPTNFDVRDGVRTRFAEFYAALFDKTIEKNPGAVVTEYAWTAQPSLKCDPCPPEPPRDADVLTLGGDIVGGRMAQGHYVLTRLHARYGKNDMKDDLRFREAQPITGGREVWNGNKGLEYGATTSAQNFFQARYAIRHAWTGPITCKNPQRGVWGGPPNGSHNTIAASKLGFAPRGKLQLASYIKRDLWEIGVRKAAPAKPTTPPANKPMGFGVGALAGLALIGLGRAARRRRG
ncbi:MAG: DUF2330 domain-containing protein [Kofleriaceae bacterium]|nr:DUF2330 domain-containing protein [Kofleriaceae bacterium]